MDKMIHVSLLPEQMRAVVKSLSIGCDQLSKKIDRLREEGGGAYLTKMERNLLAEYDLLLTAKQKIERSYYGGITEGATD